MIYQPTREAAFSNLSELEGGTIVGSSMVRDSMPKTLNVVECAKRKISGVLIELMNSIACGMNIIAYKGHNIYYQRVVIEKSNQKEKDLLFLQCVIPGDFNMEFVRLDWLRESVPYNFSAPTSSPISVTPDIVPYVNMAIRDKGLQLDTSAIVHPGTMLDLLIYLDKESSAHYDISLRYLTLTDATRSQEEVVVMNGCSVDPFVLDVFPPVDGVLRSQFRAFKFQSSDFVIFLATVSVCLQQCVEI
ncbi:ZP domain-containing protein [Nephila pilipes]|uniref:ZP domain-containing protein n=1 Tax=Nephila pilipes TaxID=299642 RepID=A0A8X6MIA9_NEPPI|nr:ZP domain-containing protein [Nephila pilipes]